jgi:transposase-like protein
VPWTETEPMKERMRFVADAERGLYSMSDLCERYDISHRTGYKWLDRYEADEPVGLKERSRAPHHCPHRIAAALAAAIVEARRQCPSWGPRRLLAWLQEHRPAQDWPAASTVGDLLKGRGWVQPRRRSRHFATSGGPDHRDERAYCRPRGHNGPGPRTRRRASAEEGGQDERVGMVVVPVIAPV